jgi:hypothetical protein
MCLGNETGNIPLTHSIGKTINEICLPVARWAILANEAFGCVASSCSTAHADPQVSQDAWNTLVEECAKFGHIINTVDTPIGYKIHGES